MALSLDQVDAQLAATSHLLKAVDTDFQRECCWLRIDHLLDVRNGLTRPPVAPPSPWEVAAQAFEPDDMDQG